MDIDFSFIRGIKPLEKAEKKPVVVTEKPMYDTLNDEQKEVFKKLKNGENTFITGNAGTGKSYLVRAFAKWCDENGKTLVKTAPTGVAAIEIGGATLHSQFKLKTNLDFEKPKKCPSWLDSTDVLLIDEISMLRIDIFDKIMSILLMAQQKRENKKRKPIQIILCGDFFQLEPVITKDERPYIEEHYGQPIGSGYPFQSKFWNLFSIHMAKLTTIIRQEDKDFCTALDMCKYGNNRCIDFIRNNSSRQVINNAIWLCGKNATVREKNESRLAMLPGIEMVSTATYKDKATEKDNLCDKEFHFKIGARVVMTINDTEKHLYQNGSLGTITSKIGDTIYVRMDRNGKEVGIGRHIFQKFEYKLGDKTIIDQNGKSVKQLEQKEIGTAEQYPMRLGYAVTIHKSQGQTYDAVNFLPEIFAAGQLYVALSRCRTVQNIYLASPLQPYMVRTSQEVLRYYENPEEYSFFDKGEEMISVTVTIHQKNKDKLLEFVKHIEKECERQQEMHGRAEELQRMWDNSDKQVVPAKKSYKDTDFKHPDLTNALKQAHKKETLKDNYQFSFEDMTENTEQNDDCPF